MIGRMVLLRGIPISVTGMLGAAAMLSVLDFPSQGYGILGAVPLAIGTFSAARGAGRRLRRGGIAVGIRCAVLLTGLWYLAAMVWNGHFGRPLLFLLTIPFGIFGGIYGVNQSPKSTKIRAHLLTFLKARIRLIFSGLHKKRKCEFS